VWRYYNLARTSASSGTQGYQASFINRAVAFYRHLVGSPTSISIGTHTAVRWGGFRFARPARLNAQSTVC